MIAEFLDSLSAKDFPGAYRPVLGALAELSCSPWKFDVLWDLWPELQATPEDFPLLAEELLSSAKSETEAIFGAVVFDDLTVFYDIVGPHQGQYPYSRAAYRVAYLSIRQMVFRSELDAAPVPPFAITQERYLERLLIVASCTSDALMPEVAAVLKSAAERYRRRGKADGVALCDQNREILQHARKANLVEGGPAAFGQQALNLMMSANHVALASEIALQWWPLFGADFHTRLRASNPKDDDALQGIAEFSLMLGRLSPFAWLNDQRPGLGSAMATLSLFRLNYRLPPPQSLLHFRSTWIGRCQESVVWLKDNWQEEPRIPKEMLGSLLDFFVKVNHAARQSAGNAVAQPTDQNSLLRGAIVLADVMVLARLRARNEISSSSYAERLANHKSEVSANSHGVEQVLLTAASLRESEPALSRALVEAANILAELSANPSLIQMVADGAFGNRDPQQSAETALRLERQGRPDLAAAAWHNTGVSLIDAGRPKRAVDALEKAWTLLIRIHNGDLEIPATAVFSESKLFAVIGETYSKALSICERTQDSLDIIESALRAVGEIEMQQEQQAQQLEDSPPWYFEGADKGTLVRLHIYAAEGLYKLSEQEAALKRLGVALEMSTKFGLLAESALIHIKFASCQPRHGALLFKHLALARECGEKERRLRVYETDKIEICSSIQAAYVWAGESHLEQGRPWEALALFEGLRSRSLLDLLGLAKPSIYLQISPQQSGAKAEPCSMTFVLSPTPEKGVMFSGCVLIGSVRSTPLMRGSPNSRERMKITQVSSGAGLWMRTALNFGLNPRPGQQH